MLQCEWNRNASTGFSAHVAVVHVACCAFLHVFPWGQAILSLSSAAKNFLDASHGKHVRLRFACEIEKTCQKVLCQTYSNQCLFGDVKTLTSPDGLAHCYAHDKMCKFRMRRKAGRILAALAILKLCQCLIVFHLLVRSFMSRASIRTQRECGWSLP